MKIIDFYSTCQRSMGLALGFFDSVHIGHRQLIQTLVTNCRKCGSMPTVFTFSNNPYEQLKKERKLVFTLEERIGILTQLGVEAVIQVNFDDVFSALSKDEFLEHLLRHFRLDLVVAGSDFTFGNLASGNIKDLQKKLNQHNILFYEQNFLLQNGQKVSTSTIAEYIKMGNVSAARQLLGSPYFVCGVVKHGREIGRTIGFPTANMDYPMDKVPLLAGVYATKAVWNNQTFDCITNVGSRPTFDDFSYFIESYLHTFRGDLYGQTLRIDFYNRLRNIQKFEHVQALKEQLNKDVLRLQDDQIWT